MEEITKSLSCALCENEILDISWSITLEYFASDMDGCFPRINEWTRFINNIENKGIDWWFEKNYKYYEIKAINEIGYLKYEIEFKESIDCLVATIWDKQIIEPVNTMLIEINYECWFSGLDNLASSIEIYFKILKLIK